MKRLEGFFEACVQFCFSPGLGSGNLVVSMGPSSGDTPKCAHPHPLPLSISTPLTLAITQAGAGGLPGPAAQTFLSEVSEHLLCVSGAGVLHGLLAIAVG